MYILGRDRIIIVLCNAVVNECKKKQIQVGRMWNIITLKFISIYQAKS